MRQDFAPLENAKIAVHIQKSGQSYPKNRLHGLRKPPTILVALT